jgi:membrane-bound lytic murein transglycosylase A
MIWAGTISQALCKHTMNQNPSYIFFQPLNEPAITYFGISAIAGRSIATDGRYFPKGALGFLEFEKPNFATPEDVEVKEWQKVRRFVFDHDRGGAIKGTGRLDLFWGRGPEAKQASGVIKHQGKLWYLKPKKSP